MQTLREDEGLDAMLGYRVPAPETSRQWLDTCHDEGQLEKREDRTQVLSFLPGRVRWWC